MFGRGTPLCMEGDPSTHLLVLLAGWAKVISSTVEGHEMVLALRGPGDVIGELAGDLGRLPHRDGARADDDRGAPDWRRPVQRLP